MVLVFKRSSLRVTLLLIALLSLLGLPSFTSQAAATDSAPCFGSGCNGRDPLTFKSPSGYSCSTPPSGYNVYTIDTASAPAGVAGIVAEIRYSEWCQAYWARGVYGPIGGETAWSFDVQLTNKSKLTIQHALITDAMGVTSGYTSMNGGPLSTIDACVEYLGPRPSKRVCTNQIKVRFVKAASFGNIGTNCNNPAGNPAPNIWKFRVTGLAPGANVAARLSTINGAFWQNVAVYPCAGAWPLRSTAVYKNDAYVGVNIFVAAYPATTTPGVTPINGQSFTLEIQTINKGTINLNYTYNATQQTFEEDLIDDDL